MTHLLFTLEVLHVYSTCFSFINSTQGLYLIEQVASFLSSLSLSLSCKSHSDNSDTEN